MDEGLSEEHASAEASTVYDPVLFHVGGKFRTKLSQMKYLTFMLIGISVLWPWNCFLSASEYYSERLSESPFLVQIYSSTMMSVSTIAFTIYTYYLSQSQKGVNYSNRVYLGLGSVGVSFVFLALSCIVDTFLDMNVRVFFVGLMTMVLLSSLATCLAQNGSIAMANVYGPTYANAVMVGQAIAGVFPSLALIISMLLVKRQYTLSGGKPKNIGKDYGIFMYYLTASIVSTASIALLYWINSYSNGMQYLSLGAEGVNQHQGHLENDVNEEEVTQKEYIPFSQLWAKLKYIALTIFLNFSITLIFPVFASNVRSTHTSSNNSFFSNKIYIPFIFLTWNFGDLLGRVLCGIPHSSVLITKPKKLLGYSIGRLIFIPLFLTCNIHPNSENGASSAIINSDIWYIILQFLFGVSNGQLCTSCFMIVGNYLENDDQKEAAGGFTSVFLSFGLACGSLFSYLLVPLVG